LDEFRPAPRVLHLDERQVDVWRVRGPLPADELRRLRCTLDASERDRADRFLVEHARETFVSARGALRSALSRYLGCDPRELEFTYGPHGKPALAGPGSTGGLEFNLSHSSRLVLFAVGRRPVGIDVERIRADIEHEQLARRFFSAAESRRLLEEAAPGERLEAFFRCWTRKEAYLKLEGAGLGFGLHRFEVTLLAHEPPRLLRTAIGEHRPDDFWLGDIEAAPDHRAALMTRRPPPELRYWELP
jgi:4'-phosphopantetheinyl transferase